MSKKHRATNNNWDMDDAKAAEKNHALHQWIIDFLNHSGGNSKLARKLEPMGNLCVGLIEYPLLDLAQIIGPDNSYKFPASKEKIDKKVAAMVRSIEEGWMPPPLIASDIWEDFFEIADGSHRQKALIKSGFEKYPTVFYFRNTETKSDFLSLR